MEKTKKMYVSPQVEVIQVENEGVIATSIDPMPIQPWSTTRSANYNIHKASGNDLEDMINDILTVED